MQTQIITEAGTVIGIYDPKNEHAHLTKDSEISKATPGRMEWDVAVERQLAALKSKADAAKARATVPAKKGLRQIASDALPKSTTGKAAMVAVPAAAALAASESSRSKIRSKYDASRDVRHYRPASPYYDDGFGKAMPPSASKLFTKLKSARDAAAAKAKAAADSEPVKNVKQAVTGDPQNFMTAAGVAATGASAAVGAVAARRAARAAAKAKVVQDAKRAQNVRDAALVGAVAAPVALGTHLASRRKVEKADEVEKGVADALRGAGKKLKDTGKKIADPAWQKQTSDRIADMSGNTARTATNLRSVVEDAKKTLIPKSKQKPPGLSLGQKAALGGAGVGGLLIGRELSGPKPYPYQQQR